MNCIYFCNGENHASGEDILENTVFVLWGPIPSWSPEAAGRRNWGLMWTDGRRLRRLVLAPNLEGCRQYSLICLSQMHGIYIVIKWIEVHTQSICMKSWNSKNPPCDAYWVTCWWKTLASLSDTFCVITCRWEDFASPCNTY